MNPRQPQPMTSMPQDYRQRSDNQQMAAMQAHQQSLQRSQSYQPSMGTGGTVQLQVQQISQPTSQQHIPSTHTIVVSQQQPQISIQNMPQQMPQIHQQQQQHSKQFMPVNQNLMQNPNVQMSQQQQQQQPQMQQMHSQAQQGISHQIQHSISTQNQAFQIQRIASSPRPGNTNASMGQVSSFIYNDCNNF
jgi:hypothetical protein